MFRSTTKLRQVDYNVIGDPVSQYFFPINTHHSPRLAFALSTMYKNGRYLS